MLSAQERDPVNMLLTFEFPYDSIVQFPTVELPDFTLVTGLNGAGKTHLMKGILAGAIKVDIAPTIENDVRYFDWTNLVPNDAGQIQTTQLYSERDQALGWIDHAKKQREKQFLKIVGKYTGLREINGDPWKLLEYGLEELKQLLSNEVEAQKVFHELQAIVQKTRQAVVSQGGTSPVIRNLEEIAECVSKPWVNITREDFDQRPFGWGSVDLFQQSFARMFLAYFETVKLNRLRQLDCNEGRTTEDPLGDEEFVAEHGEPPWEFINEVLQQAGLDFEIDHPVGYTLTKYEPKLTKRSTGTPITFKALSSGEKVLMSFAFCLYYSVDTRQSVRRPRLILLDEIDAPLHPSMCRVVVNAISKSLVAKYDVKVIMATHSPMSWLGVQVESEGLIL
jgi:hypothetical protein